jgi:hypothetical protein
MFYRQMPLRLGALLISTAMLLTLASAAPAALATSESSQSPSESVVDDTEPTNDPAEDPAVESLMRDFGLSASQAISQMDAQVAAGRAARDLPPGLAAVFSDREIRHEQGGRVVVALTSRSHVDAMVAHFASYGVSDIETRVVAHSDEQLAATARDMQRRLAESRSPGDDPHVDVGRGALGKVTVDFVDGPMNATEADVLSEARGTPDEFVVAEVDHIDVGVPDACDRTGNIECDPPLRGSVWMRNKSTLAPCSAGFNARSLSDSKPYVLTAGHCRSGSSATWETRFANGDDHDIGPFHNAEKNLLVDAGILDVNNPSGWQFGRPWITVNPNEGGHTADDSYVISDVLNPARLDRVCVTAGNWPATTCGYVTDTAELGDGTADLFVASGGLCLMGGDSGSPYFSHGVAYGIHVTSPEGATCEWGKAEQALEAADTMNVRVLEN